MIRAAAVPFGHDNTFSTQILVASPPADRNRSADRICM